MDSLTISHNHWRVPSVARAFSGWLEGKPSEEEYRRVIEETIAARAAWRPNAEGMALLEQLKEFSGYRIRIQFWDSCMWALEEEAPYPLEANCMGVTLLSDGEFPQAYLLVDDVKERPTPEGYSPQGYFQKRDDCNYLLAPLADVYEVAKVTLP